MSTAKTPRHVAIVPDGNTRWAQANNVSPFEGYRKGAERGLEIMRHSRESGVHTLTFWGLSTENWRNRPEGELEFLVELFGGMIERYLEEAMEYDVKVVHLGNKNNLPADLIERVDNAVAKTKDHTSHILNLALDYGGHDEILRAITSVVSDIDSGKLNVGDLDKPAPGYSEAEKVMPSVFSQYLDTGGQPYPFPDFIIRTSGEQRTSGFMPWQAVYAELYFEPDYWPDFTPEKFDQALAAFGKRKRRFGGGHDDKAMDKAS